nr:MAG TPA: hypothetical protein [Caudoviricetes sp.]
MLSRELANSKCLTKQSPTFNEFACKGYKKF